MQFIRYNAVCLGIRSHFGSSILAQTDLLKKKQNMAAPRYALCKHGPQCERHSRDVCGFAHALAELSLPQAVFGKKFNDESDKGGRAGIDLWFGQQYNLLQHTRLRSYIAHEEPPYPQWIEMYLWFYHKKVKVDIPYGDFGLMRRISEDLLPKMDAPPLASTAVCSLRAWIPPFQWAQDQYDIPFHERLLEHCKRREKYRVLTVRSPVLDTAYARDTTSMHWGRDSRKYLDLEAGERYVLIDESVGHVGAGWYWMAHRETQVYGWAAPGNFTPRGEVEELPALQAGITTPSQIAWKVPKYDLDGPVCDKTFWHTAPDGTDLRRLSKLAVCYSDGSVDDRKGFGVCWLCIMRDLKEQWKGLQTMPSCSHALYIPGAEASELTGCILNLYELLSCKSSWEHAVVYSDSANLVHHVGDHARDPVPPSTPQGRVLWPLIKLAVSLLLSLRRRNKYVLVKHLPREFNFCDEIARRCMRDARDMNWKQKTGTSPDRITSCKELVDALDEVSRNVLDLDRDKFRSDRYPEFHL
jgi:hypothetical protein